MKKALAGILIILVIATSLLGCSIGVEHIKGDKNRKARKFGATYMTMNNPYFEALNGSIQEIVEANGDVLIARDPLQNQVKQNEQIEEFLEEGVVAIFVNPVDWKGIEPALRKCKEQGVPIFNVDTYVHDAELVVSSIVSDNYSAGVQIAKDMMQKKSEAKIVLINHDSINSTNLRVQGFLDTIEGHPSYHIVLHRKTTAELEVAMEEMDGIINRGIDFDVVLGGNDPTALGALAALQQRRVDRDILIYGIDGSPDGKTMIKEGYLEGSSAQFPYKIGRVAAQVAYDYLNKKSVESNIIVPVELITKENLDKFDVSGWQ